MIRLLTGKLSTGAWLLAASFLFVTAASAADEVYFWKDDDGIIHYRSAPAPGWNNIETFGLLEAEDVPSRRKVARKGAHRSVRRRPAPTDYDALILQYASRHEVDPALVKAVMRVESNFNPKAVSRQGAKGLMQLMPRTARKHGIRDLFHPSENIRGGVKELRALIDRFGEHRLTWAIAAYNAGQYAVQRHGGIPPYRETRRFVKKVLRFRRIYQNEAQLASR